MGLSLLSDTARLRRIAELVAQGDGPELSARIDLMNRAIRPLSVLSVFALVASAFLDPERYSAGILALAGTPWPVWGIAALIVALHFLTRGPGTPART